MDMQTPMARCCKEHKPAMMVVLAVLLLLGIFLAAQIAFTIRKTINVGEPESFEHSIVVEGQANASEIPNIAKISFGVETLADTVANAQTENTETMNVLIEKVKEIGIESKDIQTSSYNAYEEEEWNGDTQELVSVGWVVTQTVTVTVRNLDQTTEVLTIAGQNGATNITGPNFELDDPTEILIAAREEAIRKAEATAEQLAKDLGVKLDQVVSYSEWQSGNDDNVLYRTLGLGMGGNTESASAAIEPGSEEFTLHVSVTYKIK